MLSATSCVWCGPIKIMLLSAPVKPMASERQRNEVHTSDIFHNLQALSSLLCSTRYQGTSGPSSREREEGQDQDEVTAARRHPLYRGRTLLVVSAARPCGEAKNLLSSVAYGSPSRLLGAAYVAWVSGAGTLDLQVDLR